MNKEQVYIVINKDTEERERILIGDWYLIPIFERRKDALEFMKEKFDSEDLKIIKAVLYE